MSDKKCPKCGQTATDKEYDDGTAELDFWIGEGEIWHWNCFTCNHEWKEKDGKILEE